jgi:hypothetical protein
MPASNKRPSGENLTHCTWPAYSKVCTVVRVAKSQMRILRELIAQQQSAIG